MKLAHLAGASILFVAMTACSDSVIPTQPTRSADGLVASADKGGGGTSDRTVTMMDACDGPSFTALGVLCTRNAGVTFDGLIAQLSAHGFAGAWHNSPSQMDARVGLTLFAVNNGGEIHTFTKVAHFGGGIVDVLNHVLGDLQPVPECLALTTPGHDDDFILPGGADTDDVVQSGTSLYQCCIHPWMRTVVNGKA